MRYLSLLGGLLLFSGDVIARQAARPHGFVTSIQHAPRLADHSSTKLALRSDLKAETDLLPTTTKSPVLHKGTKALACTSKANHRIAKPTTTHTDDSSAKPTATPEVNPHAETMCNAIFNTADQDTKKLQDAIKKTDFNATSKALLNEAGLDGEHNIDAFPKDKPIWNWLLQQAFKGDKGSIPLNSPCSLSEGCKLPDTITIDFCLDKGNSKSLRWLWITYIISMVNFVAWEGSFSQALLDGAQDADDQVPNIFQNLDDGLKNLQGEIESTIKEIGTDQIMDAVLQAAAGYIEEIPFIGPALVSMINIAVNEELLEVDKKIEQEIAQIQQADKEIAQDQAMLINSVGKVDGGIKKAASKPLEDPPINSHDKPYTGTDMNVHHLFANGAFITEPANKDITAVQDQLKDSLVAFVSISAWSKKIVFVEVSGKLDSADGSTRTACMLQDIDHAQNSKSEFDTFCIDNKLYVSFWGNTKISRTTATYQRTPNIDGIEKATNKKLKDLILGAVNVHNQVGYAFSQKKSKSAVASSFSGDTGIANSNKDYDVDIPLCQIDQDMWNTYKPNWAHEVGSKDYDDLHDIDYLRTVIQLCDLTQDSNGHDFPFLIQHSEETRRLVDRSKGLTSYNG